MAWFKVDDQSAFHPKVVRAGNAAFGAWVRLGAYCNAQLTDGFIPEQVALLVASKKEIEAMIDAGMLLTAEGGYQIHDYLEFQPSKAEVIERRNAIKSRVKRHRNGVTGQFGNGVTNATVTSAPSSKGSGSGSEVSSGSDPMRARVLAAWRTHTGNLMANPQDMCDVLALVDMAVADDPRFMPEAYVIAFAEWVKSCPADKRPSKSPRKFVEHFATVQEWVRGERGPGITSDPPRKKYQDAEEYAAKQQAKYEAGE